MAVPWVRTWVAPRRDHGQSAQVMCPAIGMIGALLGSGQAGVCHAQQRAVRLLEQVDLDQARPRRHLLAIVPTEAVGQAMYRHHLAERAAGAAGAGDIDQVEPARLASICASVPIQRRILSGSVSRAKTAAGGAGTRVSRRTIRVSCIGPALWLPARRLDPRQGW